MAKKSSKNGTLRKKTERKEIYFSVSNKDITKKANGHKLKKYLVKRIKNQTMPGLIYSNTGATTINQMLTV